MKDPAQEELAESYEQEHPDQPWRPCRVSLRGSILGAL